MGAGGVRCAAPLAAANVPSPDGATCGAQGSCADQRRRRAAGCSCCLARGIRGSGKVHEKGGANSGD
eukprot:3224609-Prymnesium_polylepis.1